MTTTPTAALRTFLTECCGAPIEGGNVCDDCPVMKQATRATPARPQVAADVEAALNACCRAASDWARAPDAAGYMRLAEEQAALRAAIAAQVAAAVEVEREALQAVIDAANGLADAETAEAGGINNCTNRIRHAIQSLAGVIMDALTSEGKTDG